MAAVRELFGEATDAEFPAVSAVVYGAAACWHNETLEPEASWKKKTGTCGPFWMTKIMTRSGGLKSDYDPFKNM